MKYVQVLIISIRQQLQYMFSVLMRNGMFVLFFFIFYSLWTTTAGGGTLVGFSVQQLLWYFCFTEAVELSKARLFNQIQDEVKDGTIAYTLTKPYSYVMFYLSKGLGESLVRMVPQLAVSLLLAISFTGLIPGFFTAFPFALLAVINGLILILIWQILLGLLAFWVEEVSPFYWILQKVTFVLGGLFFPIEFFPEWLQGFAKVQPFAYSTYWVGMMIADFDYRTALEIYTGQLFYIFVLLGAAGLLFSTAVRKIHANGG
jgi:ABC-2 type transport system permease protein